MHKTRAWIGIDPGKTGFIAAIIEGEAPWLLLTPTVATGKGARRQYDRKRMIDALRGLLERHDVQVIVVEKQQSYPREGVASAFNTGMGYGLWLMAATSLGIPMLIPHPKTWQKVMLRDIPAGDTKARSIQAAGNLFPGVDLRRTPRCRKDDHNKADALLLAEYGRRTASPSQKEL